MVHSVHHNYVGHYLHLHMLYTTLLGVGTSLVCHCTDRFLYNFTFEIGGGIYTILCMSLMITMNAENKKK
jgi:hypothetical protein